MGNRVLYRDVNFRVRDLVLRTRHLEIVCKTNPLESVKRFVSRFTPVIVKDGVLDTFSWSIIWWVVDRDHSMRYLLSTLTIGRWSMIESRDLRSGLPLSVPYPSHSFLHRVDRRPDVDGVGSALPSRKPTSTGVHLGDSVKDRSTEVDPVKRLDVTSRHSSPVGCRCRRSVSSPDPRWCRYRYSGKCPCEFMFPCNVHGFWNCSLRNRRRGLIPRPPTIPGPRGALGLSRVFVRLPFRATLTSVGCTHYRGTSDHSCVGLPHWTVLHPGQTV